MESLFLDLKKTLELQMLTMKQLLDTARDHNRALRQLDINLLNSSLIKEEEFAAILSRQDQARKITTSDLAKELGFNADASLIQFIDMAPSTGIKENLTTIRESIKDTALELEEINTLNEGLTKQALRVNELMLRIFTKSGKQSYSPAGKKLDQAPKLSMLDRKV